MKKLLMMILALSTISSICSAADFTSGFDITTVQLVHVDDPRYHLASVKFQEALYHQLGIVEDFNMFQEAVMKRAESKTSYAINTYTPFKAQQVYFTAAITYSIIVKKSVSRTFRDPFFDNVSHTLVASRDGGSTTITVRF